MRLLIRIFPVLILNIFFLQNFNIYSQTQPSGIELPQPTGGYYIGTADLYLSDKSRPETTPENKDFRELMVKIWYPANNTGKKLSPYINSSASSFVSQRFNFPKSFETRIKTHSFKNVPVSKSSASYPLILLEHGLGMMPETYTIFAEELASRGFIVIGTNHTYTSLVSIFPDGRSISYKAPWPTNVPRPVQGKAMGEYNLNVWDEDVTFVLNEMYKLNERDSFWRGKLDFSKIGIFGHSFGGTTSGTAPIKEQRILAGVNLDGSVYPNMTPPIMVNKPFMAITTEDTTNITSEFEGAKENTYGVTLQGSDHMSFSDTNLLRSKLDDSPSGVSNAAKSTMELEATKRLLVEFFSKYLKGQPAPDLDTKLIIKRK